MAEPALGVFFRYEAQADDDSGRLNVRQLHGVESLGAPHRFEVELFAAEPVDGTGLVGKAAALRIQTPHGGRSWHGIVERFVAMATAQEAPGRRYRATLVADWGQLRRNRQRRVWQHQSAPEIIKALFEQHGLSAPTENLSDTHAPYAYLTQFDESDGAFIRRLLEQDGLWLAPTLSEESDGEDTNGGWALSDSIDGASSSAGLTLVDGNGLNVGAPCAWELAIDRKLAVGKISLASYNADNPAQPLSAEITAGTEGEQAIERYRHRASRLGPAARDDGALKTAAKRWLNAQRAGASTVSFHCNVPVAAGSRVNLSGFYEEEVFVTQVTCLWSSADGMFHIEVAAVPTNTNFALPRRTPKPHIAGACLATVTGPDGEEVHCDDLGRVRVRFHWDRFGAPDETSSLPVRVAHPQMAGSLLIPRIGWEVVVMFEDGDPDCPYVLGRLDNGKHRPAAALPANKTMTRLATFSSPAGKGTGGGTNSLTLEDGAGRQGFGLVAAKGMSLSVGGDMLAQTVKVDEQKVDGSQTMSVSGSQTLSVQSGSLVGSSASQSISIGGSQSFKTPKAIALSAGSVSVTAASLSEQVGSPGGGLGDLATTAAFTALGSAGGAKGMALAAVAKAGMAYQQGGAKAAGAELLKTGANLVPGVGTAIDVAEASGEAPWQKKADEGGGSEEDAAAGTGGAQGVGGASDGGGGKRITSVAAGMTETVGGAYLVTTPGSSSWTTLGAAALTVGGSHGIASGIYGFSTLGAASVAAPALNITSAGPLTRTGRLLKLTVAGALSSKSAADTVIKAGGALSLTAGSLKLNGGTVVLQCGASKVTIKGGGIVAQSASITFAGSTKAAEASR